MDTGVSCLSKEFLSTGSNNGFIWSKLRHSKVRCDAILQTNDGGSFPVHKIVMCLCSDYFRALFLSRGHIEKRTVKWFLIPGINAEVLKSIVDFAYSGRPLITEENVSDLLIGADQFNVLYMLKYCCEFIKDRINIFNCINVREFATNFFCNELKEEAHRYLMCHFEEVIEQSDEFLDLSLEKVIELLNSDYVNVRNEELIWEAGLRWIEYNPTERKEHVNDILKCVRLGLLNSAYFMEKVKRQKYVKKNVICKPIVIHTMKFLFDVEQIRLKQEEVETPFIATPRIPFSILFAIGGWKGGSPTNLIETYDSKADRWTKVDDVDSFGCRAYHKLAVIGHDIYVIGGFDGKNYLSDCKCFNAVTKDWRDIAPMSSKRCYVSVATLNDIIYAMGGFDGDTRLNTAEKFDFRRNQWSFIAPMNIERSDASATSHNGLIYIVGGCDGRECLSTCEFYNPVTDHWTTISPMQNRRSGVSIISHHGKIYALGGFNGNLRLSNGESYDPESEEWSEVPDMYNPRSNFAIEVLDDMIFVIGGFNGEHTTSNVECFDDRTNEWYEATDMNSQRSALTACVVPNLPNINDYIYQNRKGLMEEKRQFLIQGINMNLG